MLFLRDMHAGHGGRNLVGNGVDLAGCLRTSSVSFWSWFLSSTGVKATGYCAPEVSDLLAKVSDQRHGSTSSFGI